MKKGAIVPTTKVAKKYKFVGWRFPSQKSKDDAIAGMEVRRKAVERSIDEIKARRPDLPPLSSEPEVGDIGILGKFKVVQVIDDESAMITISDKRLELENALNTSLIKVVGLPTKGIVDGREYESARWIKVAGTHRYETALGTTNTVPLIQPLNAKEIKEFLSHYKPKLPGERGILDAGK